MAKNQRSHGRWVVGVHSVLEALSTQPGGVLELCCLQGKGFEASVEKQLQKWEKKLGGQFQWRNKKFFNDLSEVHQGIAVRMSERPRWQQSEKSHQVLAFLDGLNDPHNLGAILRTSWLLGVGGLFLPKNRTVKMTPTVSKVASGGAEHVPLEEVHFASQVDELKKQGFWVYGLSHKAKATLPQMKFAEKSIFMLGAEGAGLRSSSENLCDELVAIPQASAAASFNASVAFSLAIYEYTRQHPKG